MSGMHKLQRLSHEVNYRDLETMQCRVTYHCICKFKQKFKNQLQVIRAVLLDDHVAVISLPVQHLKIH